MKNKDIIRRVFKTLAIILFIIQFQQSVRKYFQYPVVELESRIPVNDLPAPIVYVCQPNQFNYTKARDNGYRLFGYFATGILMNSSKLSWHGMHGNKTYKDLERELFEYDYSTLNGGPHSIFSNLESNINFQNIFLFPHGVCIELKNLPQQPKFWIKTTKNSMVMFVDPAQESYFRTAETFDARAKMGPTSEIHFTLGLYNIEYSLHDESIHDGTSCTDYSKSKMSYGLCLKNIVRQEFMSTYGCLPPWFSRNELKEVCKEDIKIDADALKETLYYQDIQRTVNNFEAKLFKKCLTPCKTLKIKLQEVLHKTTYLDTAYFIAESSDWATVHSQVYSYDIFSLTVDLGSALGLWLGLSCLSILDHILESWIVMKKYWKK